MPNDEPPQTPAPVASPARTSDLGSRISERSEGTRISEQSEGTRISERSEGTRISERSEAPSIALETFPQDEETRAALYWMGDDYGARLARDLSLQLAEDDPQGRMLGLKCLGWPQLEVEAREGDDRVIGVRAQFELRALMRAGDGSHWHLAVHSTYTATDLEREDGGSFSAVSEVTSAEPAP